MKTDHIPANWRIEKEGRSQRVYDPDGAQRCGRVTSRGTPCMKYPVKGRLRCATHGGTFPRGELHPHATQGGKYSQYASPSLRERMARVSEGELTDLTENMALIDARLSMLVEQAKAGDFSGSVDDALALYNRAATKLRSGDMEGFLSDYNELGTFLRSAKDDYRTWNSILNVNRERRDMARAVHQMVMQKEGMMHAAEVVQKILELADLFLEINKIDDQRVRENQFRTGAARILEMPTGA